MKLIHVTAKRIKNFSADIAYILNLAENFGDELKNDYQLIVAEGDDTHKKNFNILDLKIKPLFKNINYIFYYTYLRYFFWFPFFFKKQNDKNDIIFFSNDVNLILILIFWRSIFKAKYKICSDWHMLFKNKKEKSVIKNSDFLITTSEKLKNNIIELAGIKKEKIKTVYGGVDLNQYGRYDKIELRKKLNLSLDKKLISYVGLFKTMGLDKGIETMIQSLRYLDDDIIMVFVGARNDEIEEYKKIATEYGVVERCIIVEKRPFNEVVEYEQAVDVLAIPYPDKPHFRDYGFPMKVYEYMAAGNPIVYSGLELSEEVLSDCGFVFEPDNPEDLAFKINHVMDEKNKSEVELKVKTAWKKLNGLDWKGKVQTIIKFIK